MIKFILKMGLLLLPFILEVNLFPVIPREMNDYRGVKEFLSVICAAGVTFAFLKDSSAFHFNCPPVLWFMFYMVAHPYIAPTFKFEDYSDNVIASLWNSRMIMHSLIYFGFAATIASIHITKRDVRQFHRIFFWVGTLLAIYCLLQALGYDQFQNLNTHPDTKNTTSAGIPGTLTHPNYAATYLGMCLFFTIYQRQWLASYLIFGTMVIIQSMFPLIAAGSCLAVYGFYKMPQYHRFKYGSLVILSGVCFTFLFLDRILGGDNGRFPMWQTIWDFMARCPLSEGKSFLITGLGFGSYMHIFAGYLGERFFQAHNELLQLIAQGGLVAGGIFIFYIFWLIKRFLPYILKSEECFVLALTIGFTLLCSLGQFNFQIEPHRFVTVFLLGWAHNIIQKGERV